MSGLDSKKGQSTDTRYLCFSLGQQKFAMPLLQVKEVIASAETTSIPQSPAYFRGILNLRGQVISIIDLRSKLKIGKAELASETTIVILDLDGHFIGVVVDSVDAVLSFEASSISGPPAYDPTSGNDFIVGVAKKEKALILLIDLKKVLSNEDLRTVRSQSPKAA